MSSLAAILGVVLTAQLPSAQDAANSVHSPPQQAHASGNSLRSGASDEFTAQGAASNQPSMPSNARQQWQVVQASGDSRYGSSNDQVVPAAAPPLGVSEPLPVPNSVTSAPTSAAPLVATQPYDNAASPLNTSPTPPVYLPANSDVSPLSSSPDLSAESSAIADAPLAAEPAAIQDVQAPTTSPSHTGYANRWLQRLLTPSGDAPLPGEPISLVDALSVASSTSKQNGIIKTYWTLVAAVGRYRIALDELNAARTAGMGAAADPALAEYAADVAVRKARIEATNAQNKLARLIDMSTDRLPLPVTRPLTGRYRSRYEEIFANRVHRRAWELNYLIEQHYELTKSRIELIQQLQSNGLPTAREEAELLTTIQQYNHAIAQYVAIAAPQVVSGSDIVPLLIKVDTAAEQQIASQLRTLAGIAAPSANDQPPARVATSPSSGGGNPSGRQDDWQAATPRR